MTKMNVAISLCLYVHTFLRLKAPKISNNSLKFWYLVDTARVDLVIYKNLI